MGILATVARRVSVIVCFLLLSVAFAAAVPVITSISPSPVPAGATISVVGSGFGTTKGTVTIAGVTASIVSWSNNSISVVVPSNVPTGADPVVVTAGGISSAPKNVAVQFAPSLASISPTIGLPNSEVTLTGVGFGANTPGTVSFNGVGAQIISWNDTKIVVKTPDGAAGRGPVIVSWQGVNSNGIAFNFIPTIGYLSNSTVYRYYGSFAIVGQNFLPNAGTVTLNGVPIPIYSWSNNSISLPVPQDNCTGPIVVTTAYGASNPVTLTIVGSTSGCVASSPLKITATATPSPNAAGWNNSDVTLSYTCSGGIAPLQCPASQTISVEGAGQTITAQAKDSSGATASASTTLNIDKSKPTISGTISPQPNTAGWNNAAASVSFQCSDSVSGVASCPSPVTVTNDGANQPISGTVTDKAGNTATFSTTVSLDKTAPTISATVAPPPDATGWNRGDVTVNYTCSDSVSGVDSCPLPQTVTTEGQNQQIVGSVKDKAGNTASAAVVLNIDKSVPTITGTVTPPPNAAGWNNSDVTVQFACTGGMSGVKSCSLPVLVATEGKAQEISGSVTNGAGLTKSTTVTVNLDKTAPLISATASPNPNSAQWNNTDVVVTYSCIDAMSGIQLCPSPTTITTEGAQQQIIGEAVDLAGNKGSGGIVLSIDKTAPEIHVSQFPLPNSAGWNNTNVTLSYECVDKLSGIANCPLPNVISAEGPGQSITSEATDIAGNVASGVISLSIDKTAPSIVSISTPETISSAHPGQVVAVVTDGVGIDRVNFLSNGVLFGSATSEPYSALLAVPATAAIGDTLTVTVDAIDLSGNVSSASRGVKIAGSGVLVGQVLSDATGLPLSDAVITSSESSIDGDISDPLGRYLLPVKNDHVFVSITRSANAASDDMPAMLPMEREVAVQPNAGTVVVDARMTGVADPVVIDIAGGNINGKVPAGLPGVSVSIAAGTLSRPTSVRLTAVSGQGLPNLLPLGWSPVSAFDLQSGTSISGGMTATFSRLPSTALHLVSYNFTSHAWIMIQSNLAPLEDGTISVALPSVGDYALVVADTDVASLPSAGSVLQGLTFALISSATTTSGALSPAILPAVGGISQATLQLQAPDPLPSGTIVQSVVSESYQLRTGSNASQESRLQDLVLYRTNPASGLNLAAQFPVTPSRSYKISELISGKVHLDILAGREGVRGQIGGNAPISAQSNDGSASVTVAGGALSQDTVVSIYPISVSSSLPSSAAITPLAEVYVDFSDKTLSSTAQISVSLPSLTNASASLFVAEILRVDGIEQLSVVSLAQISGSKVLSMAYPGLKGIIVSGRYVIYSSTSPLAFVAGTTLASGMPVGGARVGSDSLPFIGISNLQGKYSIAVLAGTANLTAGIQNTELQGTASTQTTAGNTSLLDVLLNGIVTTATVTPTDGAIGVSTSSQINISCSRTINRTTITRNAIKLYQGEISGGQTVDVNFVVSPGDTDIAVIPAQTLQAGTKYTLAASGIADSFGGLVSVPVTSFTTKPDIAPAYDLTKITFSLPDEHGNVTVSAPVGTLPPGATILILDQTNGIVFTLTVANDGSVSGQFAATIDDIIQVSVTAPDGTVVSFTRSQFVALDGTTAVGAGGGEVAGPGNLAMIIPANALKKGTTFKLALLDQSAFSELPDLPGANFGSGMSITAPDMPSFDKEVKLAFPVPANAPDGAFFYVFRRLTDSDGNSLFETIDHAFIQGTGADARVVTASPPFCGYMNSYGNFQGSATTGYQPTAAATVMTFMMWDYDPNQAGIASPGLLVGKVFERTSSGTLGPLTGGSTAMISLSSSDKLVSIATPDCGMYTIFDPQRGGGSRSVTGVRSGTNEKIVQTAYEVNGIQPDDALFSITAGLANQYRNIGRLNFTFATPPAAAAPAKIMIDLYDAKDVARKSGPITGFVTKDSWLRIAFRSNLTVVGATINGTSYSSVVSDTPPSNPEKGIFYTQLAESFAANPTGVYTIVVTAIDPQSPQATPATVSSSFLVVESGGSRNSYSRPNEVPKVVVATPRDKATGVATTTMPSLIFDQPVTNIPGNVSIEDDLGSADIVLIGVRPDGSIANPIQPNDIVTSLTIQPLSTLKFGTHYTVTLKSGIVSSGIDENGNAIPKLPLALYTLSFTTFAPAELATTDTSKVIVTRPAIIGQRAYVGEIISPTMGGIGIFDLSDPAYPSLVGSAESWPFSGRALDVVGMEQSPVTGNPLLAVSSGTAMGLSIPANVWLYDVSDPDNPSRVGVVSVSSSANQAGIALRLAMKGNYLYASNFMQGLQVIDLQQALDEFRNTPVSVMGQATSIDGQGFASDSIVNTIQLPLASGGQAVMWDLKADDFPTSYGDNTGASQTLLVATGQLPLVVADPTFKVAYPPSSDTGSLSQAPLELASSDGESLNQFILGRAVAVGTVGATNSNGTSQNMHVGVLVGTGRSGPAQTVNSSVAGPALMVVSFDQPYVFGGSFTPKPISYLPLPAAPSDVILKGSMALVATGTNVILVDLKIPSAPRIIGQIEGSIGRWLAMTEGGILVSDPGVGDQGLKTSTFKPVLVILKAPPVIAKDVTDYAPDAVSTPVSQLSLETVTDAALYLRIVPSSSSLGSAQLTITPAVGGPIAVDVALVNGNGGFTVPTGTIFRGATIRADATAETDAGPLQSLPRLVNVAAALATVDSNNDQKVRDGDRAVRQSSKFPFWQSEPDRVITYGGIPIGVEVEEGGLVDYATFKLTLTSEFPAGKLEIVSTGDKDVWSLTDKAVINGVTNDWDYLKDLDTVKAQLAVANSGCNANQRPAKLGGSCPSTNGSVDVTRLDAGDYYLLFRCSVCSKNDSRQLQVRFTPSGGSPLVLDSSVVDIRPVKDWMSVYSVRHDSSSQTGTAAGDCTNANRPDSEAHSDNSWAPVPPKTGTLTFLVHGFAVDKAAAENGFFPQYLKKLYWAGHPVIGRIPGQQTDAHVIGFEWPGDGMPLHGWTPYIFFPMDEMHALESGVPFAKLVTAQAENAGAPSIHVIAHSLGNMVVNSGLMRPELSDNVIDTYIMNDAAVASEAFVEENTPTELLDPILVSHSMLLYGLPTDQLWENRWKDNYIDDPQKSPDKLRDLWLGMMEDTRIKKLNSWRPRYCFRWRQQRGVSVIGDEAPVASPNAPSSLEDCSITDYSSLPLRGSWAGYFFSNNKKKTKIVNTYNTADNVLNVVWKMSLQNLLSLIAYLAILRYMHIQLRRI